jgi:hypothetical protein
MDVLVSLDCMLPCKGRNLSANSEILSPVYILEDINRAKQNAARRCYLVRHTFRYSPPTNVMNDKKNLVRIILTFKIHKFKA